MNDRLRDRAIELIKSEASKPVSTNVAGIVLIVFGIGLMLPTNEALGQILSVVGSLIFVYCNLP